MSQLAGSRKASPTSSEGSAGAIVSGGQGTAAGKIEALKAAGIAVAETLAKTAEMLIAQINSSI
ncbi:MAG TPA: hypothetical protein VNX27_05985 [Chthoniobacterales bacterium]|jgi:succinyl-CoA synthetase alpha subunit|nr:hypothetical protein [Chthoniobacterales bacterium]